MMFSVYTSPFELSTPEAEFPPFFYSVKIYQNNQKRRPFLVLLLRIYFHSCNNFPRLPVI